MARGKNSPALFEVIRNAQQKQKEQLERQRQQQLAADVNAVSPAAALLRSPILWLKGKQAHEASLDTAGETVTQTATVERPVVARRADVPIMREIPPARPAVVAESPKAEPPRVGPVPTAFVPMASFDDEEPEVAVVAPSAPRPASAAAEAARQVREELSAQEAPAAEPMFGSPYDSAYDADDEDARPAAINLQFNYTTAIVAGFAILVAFSVAYIIGTAGRSSKTLAQTPPSVRPEVLEVRTKPTPPVRTTATPEEDARASLPTGSDLALDTLGKPIAVPTNVKRVAGTQYLVLLSFPREEDARDLVKFLAQNGVPATAEKALPGYAKSWTSVVTTRGFDHTKKNPAFDAYSSALRDLLPKYAGDSKFRKTFKIDVYTWRVAR